MHGGLWGPWLDDLGDPLALDMPGHGRRPREERLHSLGDVADDLVTTVGQPAVWIGWSLGGLVALRAAFDYPDRVEALVLLCSGARFVQGDDWNHGIPSAVFRQFAEGLEGDYVATLDRFMALEAHGAEHARRDLAELRRRAHRYPPPTRATLRDGLAILEESDLRDRLATLAMPVLLIGGSRDRLVAPRALEATAALIPGSRLAIIRGAGHAPFVGHADALTGLVRPFLEDVVR